MLVEKPDRHSVYAAFTLPTFFLLRLVLSTSRGFTPLTLHTKCPQYLLKRRPQRLEIFLWCHKNQITKRIIIARYRYQPVPLVLSACRSPLVHKLHAFAVALIHPYIVDARHRFQPAIVLLQGFYQLLGRCRETSSMLRMKVIDHHPIDNSAVIGIRRC